MCWVSQREFIRISFASFARPAQTPTHFFVNRCGKPWEPERNLPYMDWQIRARAGLVKKKIKNQIRLFFFLFRIVEERIKKKEMGIYRGDAAITCIFHMLRPVIFNMRSPDRAGFFYFSWNSSPKIAGTLLVFVKKIFLFETGKKISKSSPRPIYRPSQIKKNGPLKNSG